MTLSEVLIVLLGFSVGVPLTAAGFGWVWDEWAAALKRQWKRVTK